MRLFEAIVEANHRALSGDAKAGLHPTEFADALPLVALTCIDPRLNPLMPEVLGVPEDKFIWLRNAGNIIFDPMSSMMRTLALACAVKGGKEIALIGHTDCHVRNTSMSELIDLFKALGVERARLPENLNEFFGLFASERQNVIRSAEFVRSSPLIGPKIPVHGLLVDITTGKLEWLVNGYQTLGTAAAEVTEAVKQGGLAASSSSALPELRVGELKFPEFQIGESPIDTTVLSPKAEAIGATAESIPQPAAPSQKPTTAPTLQLDQTRAYRIVGSDKKIYGPVSGTKVVLWIEDGRIDWQTLARPEGGVEWKPLSAWAVSSRSSSVPAPPLIQVAVQSKHRSKS